MLECSLNKIGKTCELLSMFKRGKEFSSVYLTFAFQLGNVVQYKKSDCKREVTHFVLAEVPAHAW